MVGDVSDEAFKNIQRSSFYVFMLFSATVPDGCNQFRSEPILGRAGPNEKELKGSLDKLLMWLLNKNEL
jgi:hypothetical protein